MPVSPYGTRQLTSLRYAEAARPVDTSYAMNSKVMQRGSNVLDAASDRQESHNGSVSDENDYRRDDESEYAARQRYILMMDNEIDDYDRPTTNGVSIRKEHPQVRMNKFWSNFEPEYQGGITQILPQSVAPVISEFAAVSNEGTACATLSYQHARDRCIKQVKRIIRECRDLNQKYTDVHFDIEYDMKIAQRDDCLQGLDLLPDDQRLPHDVRRVPEIFQDPQFYKDGASYDDIIQGVLGDCWFLAGLSALTTNEALLRKVCVIQDPEVGVYGFVFYRDGEWQPCIIDDKLYLSAPSYEESSEEVITRYGLQFEDAEKKYTELFSSGSIALCFASCRDPNETWVPLLEKAFAKAHGDYFALCGGITGEALEDLTGGVTTVIHTTSILSKEKFWKENLCRIGKDFIFSCCTAFHVDWMQQPDHVGEKIRAARREGVLSRHAYAIVDTYEGHGQRLVKVRNPWGKKEWSGAWSDGSKEWTADWMQRLNHKFGDDGVFWISYSDLLKRYKYMDRTRIFGPEWYVAQQWTSAQVPWNTSDYQQTKFTIAIPEDTEAVLVLSQLDDRYFRGLQGPFSYTLQFRVQDDAEEDGDEYIARSISNYELKRSVNVEIFLRKGSYTVLFKIEAHKNGRLAVEDVVKKNIGRKQKITRLATLYDLAHSKGKPSKSMIDQPTDSTRLSEMKEDSTCDDDADRGTAGIGEGDVGATDSKADKKDGKKEEEEERESSVRDERMRPKPVKTSRMPPPSVGDKARDPWNAYCHVGLRVYTKCADLKLNVVWPIEERPVTLDRDDIAKAALDEAEAASAQKEEEKDDEGSSDGTGEGHVPQHKVDEQTPNTHEQIQ